MNHSLSHYIISAFLVLSVFRAIRALYADINLFKFSERVYGGRIPWRVIGMAVFNIGIIIDVFYALSVDLPNNRLLVIFTLNTILECSLSYAGICVLRELEQFNKNNKE